MFNFSDSAKYAEAANNLLFGKGLSINHSFFDLNLLSNFQINHSFPAGFLPGTSMILSIIFKIFGTSDTSILIAGLLFYILCATLVFLIAKTVASTKAGIISVCLFASSLFFHEYLNNFSSEIPFTLEILLITYFFLRVNKPIYKWPLILVLFIAACFTRQQVSVVLLSLATSVIIMQYFAFSSDQKKKTIPIVFVLIFVSAIGLFLTRNSNISPLTLIGATNISSTQAPGVIIRGGQMTLNQQESLFSKVFYNTYNFAKAPERLAFSPIFLLFIVFLFLKSPSNKSLSFKLFSGFSFVLFILAASATIPNARYVHPIMPLIYIGSGIALVEISKMISNKRIISTAFIISSLLFITLPTIGHHTLDARAISRTQNTNQPTIYRQIAKVMGENLPKGHLIVTNLDAWAAWYEGLTTMWFPLKPEMLNIKNKPEYIVITNYLENDRDFALGDWKEVVYAPNKISNKFLKDNYVVIKTFIIDPKENRESIEIKGTILKLK